MESFEYNFQGEGFEAVMDFMMEFGLAFLGIAVVLLLVVLAVALVCYVLGSIGLYSIAKRRGIANPWLAWIPVAWVWVLGSISDQFRYVTKAQVKSKRKVLLALNIVCSVVALAMSVICLVNVVDIIEVANYGTEEQMMTLALTMLFQILGLGLLGGVVSIVFAVFHYIALYDLYTSVNPPCNVLFLVLSILFNVTQPFFIFFNRKMDGGMPPRCDVPQPPVGITLPVTVVQEETEETEAPAEPAAPAEVEEPVSEEE